MNLQPVLTGPTLSLAPIRPEDGEELYAVARDPLIWALHPAQDRWQRPDFEAYFARWLLAGGGLAVRERATGRVIGASCYSAEGRLSGEVEIGWTFLARDNWGGATNGEVKSLMIGHALQSVEQVVFRVAESNLRSRRALEKIGATLTDPSEPIEINGRPVPHLVYAITSSSVPAARAA